MFKSTLWKSLETIVLSDLGDRETFENKVNELNSVEDNDYSHKNEAEKYFYYTLNYHNKFKELEREVRKTNKLLKGEEYDNLLFFVKKILNYGKKVLNEYGNPNFSSNKNPKMIHGLVGGSYFWLAKSISKGGRVKDLSGILENGEKDKKHFIVALFSEAIKHYEISREFGNMEKENDSKIGASYVELAGFSDNPIERYENLLKGIMNLERSRRNGNDSMTNDEYIATSYQEMGNLISSLDLLLSPEESRRIVEIKEEIYHKTKGYFDCFELLNDLNVSEDSRFKKMNTEITAIAFFMQSLKEYDYIRGRKRALSAEDYTYRGKCALRLSKLKHFPEHIKMAVSDFEKALKLRKDPFIYSYLGEAHFILAHNYFYSIDNTKKRVNEFRRAASCYIRSNRAKNIKQEVYGMIAESYRHLLKEEFRKKDINARSVVGYLKNSVKYAKKAIGMEGK